MSVKTYVTWVYDRYAPVTMTYDGPERVSDKEWMCDTHNFYDHCYGIMIQTGPKMEFWRKINLTNKRFDCKLVLVQTWTLE